MQSQLAQILVQLESALTRVRRLRADVPPSVWGRRPEPGRWSAGECVAHLNLTSAAMMPLLRAGMEQARRSNAAAPPRYRRDPWGWLIWKSSGPSGRFKVKTVAAFVPSADRPPDELVAEFERWQAEIVACVHEAEGLPLQHVKVVSPFDARVRYNLFSALSILAAHQHRHLGQAELAGSL